MKIISAHKLEVQLDQQPILKDISFHAKKGEFVGLIGPNGSGKSTLLRAAIGLIPIALGELYIEDKALKTFKARELARIIGYVPQDTTADFSFSAQDIVLMGRHPFLQRFGLESKRDYEIAAQAMSMTDTLHLAERTIANLSGGQRQMIFIAKALAQQPQVMLLDEPISALDLRYQLRVLTLIRQLANDGLTAIAALHDLNLAARFCDRLILISEGRIISQGSPEEVLKDTTIKQAYGVHAEIHLNPWTNTPTVTAMNADDNKIY